MRQLAFRGQGERGGYWEGRIDGRGYERGRCGGGVWGGGRGVVTGGDVKGKVSYVD